MSKAFKTHSIDAIENCLAEALTELLGEDTFVLIEQLEMNGALEQGVKLVLRAHPERRAGLPDITIDLL